MLPTSGGTIPTRIWVDIGFRIRSASAPPVSRSGALGSAQPLMRPRRTSRAVATVSIGRSTVAAFLIQWGFPCFIKSSVQKTPIRRQDSTVAARLPAKRRSADHNPVPHYKW